MNVAEVLKDLGFAGGQAPAGEGSARRIVGANPPPTPGEVLRSRAAARSVRGRKALINRAIDALTQAGVSVPYNISWVLPGLVSTENPAAQEELLRSAARVAGWIRYAVSGKAPTLRRLLKKSLSCGGVNSPHTTVDLGRLIAARPSPGAVNRLAAAVIRRADAILSPYGLRVSWAAIADQMVAGGHRVGKLAARAAEATARAVLATAGIVLRDDRRGCRLFRGWTPEGKELRGPLTTALAVLRGHAAWRGLEVRARAWATDRVNAGEFNTLGEAVAAAGRLVEDATDGVAAVIDPVLSRQHRGVSVTPYWIAEPGRRRPTATGGFLVRLGGRSFHTDKWWYGARLSRAGAVRQAREAWVRQDAAAQEEGDLESLLTGTHPRLSVLVRRQDSYRAGNCSPGTEAFAQRHGLAVPFVPLPRLWRLAVESGESRAIAVCREAARRGLADLRNR